MGGMFISFCLFIEIAIIDLQAARGTSSHFNYLDDAGWHSLRHHGRRAILILWFATVWLTILLFPQPFSDAPLGWALRLGHVDHGCWGHERGA